MSDFGWSYPAGCSGPPDDDYAEVCPVCAAPNHAEETGEPLCAAAPDFCSVECERVYCEREAKASEAEAHAFDRWRDERMEGP